MKKREYLSPETVVVPLCTTNGLLAGSVTGSISSEEFNGDAGAPELPGFNPLDEVKGAMGIPFM